MNWEGPTDSVWREREKGKRETDSLCPSHTASGHRQVRECDTSLGPSVWCWRAVCVYVCVCFCHELNTELDIRDKGNIRPKLVHADRYKQRTPTSFYHQVAFLTVRLATTSSTNVSTHLLMGKKILIL